MKKSTKIWLIAAAALLAVGLALCVAALASVDFDFAKLGTEGAYETRTYAFDAERLASAEVISVSQDIRIVGSDEKAGTVEYPVGEKVGYEVSFSDGTLLVRHYDHRKWYEHIGLFFSFRDDAVVVYVPTDAVFALTCESTSGSTSCPALPAEGCLPKAQAGASASPTLRPPRWRRARPAAASKRRASAWWRETRPLRPSAVPSDWRTPNARRGWICRLRAAACG